MARGNRVGVKESKQRRNQQREQDSEESDEEYKVTEEEEWDDSDEYCSLDGEESEEILADFEGMGRVVSSRNTRRTSSGRKGNEIKKPRKRRRVFYAEDDDDDDDGDGDAECMSLGREAYQIKKPRDKKRVSYIEVEDNDEDYAEFVSSGGTGNQMIKPQEKSRVSYIEEEEEEEDEDDAEFISSGRKVNQKKKLRERKKVSYTEEDDENDSEFTSSSRRGNQKKKLREKRKVSYTEDDKEDDSEFMSSSRKGNPLMKPLEESRVSCTEEDEDEDEDDAEFMSLGWKRNQKKKLREKRKVSSTEDDEEDYEEFMSSSRKGNQIMKPQEKTRVSYIEEDEKDEDDADFMSFGRRGNQQKKLREKRKVSYTEDDEEDYEEFTSSSRKGNRIKKPRDMSRVSNTEEDEEEDEDDAEFMSLGRKGNQKKKLREKKKVSYTEDDEEEYEELTSSSGKGNHVMKPQEISRVSFTEEDEEDGKDDAEFMSSDRKREQKKNLREKREVSYKEDDEEDDLEFTSSSGKGNQIKKPREKRMVSHKEDDEEEEDENDEEFMLSESDLFDDDDESPKMKKNEKVSRCRSQKKSFGGRHKKNKKSKIHKKPTRPKQRNHKFSRKLGSSKERSLPNKNQVEKQSKKISRRQKWRTTAESDSDFVSSASSDHEYTISEEEREQMREARVYCANLRAKLRSSSCGKQEEEPLCDQNRHHVQKGKEKVDDMKDEVGKQVCGICLSEEGKRTVRGVLNCCRHYFCFSCIMEWSKVESRCPVCKQRFTTITKAAKSDTGFDLRTVVIPVPECDQVYEPSEEELRGYLDPYESVICTECHHGGDDALMLLCDICDSPAHTFCVGLGREVPEGNWYCEGCRPTVFASLNSQRPTPTSDRRLSSNASDLSSPVAGGFDLNELYVPETPLTEQTRVLPEPRLPVGDFIPAGTGATTLRDRRRIHRQIHHRFLNNNRMGSGTSASSSGIRLFGSQLDQARVSSPQGAASPHPSFDRRDDQVMPSMCDTNLFSPRTDQFDASIGGSGMAFDSRMGYAQLHPCTNGSSIGSDANRLHMRAGRL